MQTAEIICQPLLKKLMTEKMYPLICVVTAIMCLRKQASVTVVMKVLAKFWFVRS